MARGVTLMLLILKMFTASSNGVARAIQADPSYGRLILALPNWLGA